MKVEPNDRIKRLEKWAFGNGEEGAAERLRKIEDTMANLDGSMQTLNSNIIELNKAERERTQAERERKLEKKAEIRERRGFYAGVGLVLSALGYGGIRFAQWMADFMNRLSQAMGGDIPPFGGIPPF